MGRLQKTDDGGMEILNIGGKGNFSFSAVKMEKLGATEYTLVTIGVDLTGSTADFADKLREMLITSIESCKKSPRSNNLLVRVILFSTSFPNGIQELHGFKPLSEIDPNQYPQFQPMGQTPLNDAAYSAVGATNVYAKNLMDQDFLANGIVMLITDGDDNASSATISMIQKEMERGMKGEEIESLVGVLIGINAAQYKKELEKFEQGTGMKYIDAGDVTKGKLAKLAEFVSQSVSSQSQALGTGGPSQKIAATI